jgi:ABC-type polysaccharide/polyol phosphate export permease
MFNPSLKSVYLFVPGLMALILMLSVHHRETAPVLDYRPCRNEHRPADCPVHLLRPHAWQLRLIYLVSAIYMLVVLGIGLLISTVTETQQQAMFVAWFFMVIFTLMSGLFTAIESMPHWAQTMTFVNPVRHFVDIMRRVMLKGSGLMEIRVQLLWLVGYAAVMVTLAVNRYRKVVA